MFPSCGVRQPGMHKVVGTTDITSLTVGIMALAGGVALFELLCSGVSLSMDDLQHDIAGDAERHGILIRNGRVFVVDQCMNDTGEHGLSSLQGTSDSSISPATPWSAIDSGSSACDSSSHNTALVVRNDALDDTNSSVITCASDYPNDISESEIAWHQRMRVRPRFPEGTLRLDMHQPMYDLFAIYGTVWIPSPRSDAGDSPIPSLPSTPDDKQDMLAESEDLHMSNERPICGPIIRDDFIDDQNVPPQCSSCHPRLLFF